MSGAELRELRLAADLTQRELGDRLGVAGNTVARWERGESPILLTTDLAIRQVLRASGNRTQSDSTETSAEEQLGTAGHADPVAEESDNARRHHPHRRR